MVIKVGINGFGRIGRVIFRTCLQNPDIELSAINDPAIDIEYMCYLIKFDSTHGKFKANITHTADEIKIDDSLYQVVAGDSAYRSPVLEVYLSESDLTPFLTDGKSSNDSSLSGEDGVSDLYLLTKTHPDRLIKVFRDKLPHTVPWQVVGVQYVVEASGMFTCLEKASGHLASDSVKRVIITAPSVDVPMIIMGVNDNQLNAAQKVLSCASSTLYCLAPIVKVLEENFGVSEGFITSIHAMTPSLKPLDGLCLKGKHWRDHRSIHQNIIPATTGSCKALAKIIPQVKDKMTGLAFRVPIVNVSVLDMTVRLDTSTSLQDIIKSVDKAAKTCLRNIIKISNEEAVSSDFNGDSHSCILDADSSLQLSPNFYKLICWYENEYSYACRVLDSIFFSERQFNTLARLPCKMTYVRAKLSKKQDEVQQTERTTKDTLSIECNTEVPKCTTSAQDTMSRRPPVRPVILRKPVSSHGSGPPVTTVISRDSKKRNELFKIWNDNNDAQKHAARQKRSSFFHSCMAFGPKQDGDCKKAQERLENVKKEFSKMVNITEDLLKKSNVDKLQLGVRRSSFERVKSIANEELTDSKITIKGNSSPTNTSIFSIGNDYMIGLSASRTDCRNDASRCCSSSDRNSNNSEYKIANAVKKIVIDKPYLVSREKMAYLVSEKMATQNTLTNYGLKATVENKLSAKAHDPLKLNRKYSTNVSFKAHITRNDNYFMNSLSNKSPLACAMKEQKRTQKKYDATMQFMEEKQIAVKNTEDSRRLNVTLEKKACNSQETDPPEKIALEEFEQYLNKKEYNMRIIDEALQKRNIVLVNNERSNNFELICKANISSEQMIEESQTCSKNINEQILENLTKRVNQQQSTTESNSQSSYISSEQVIMETEICGKNMSKQILDTLNKRVPGPVVIVPVEPDRTAATNGNGTKKKLDLYDKLDSASATNSTNSFEINEKKSEVLQICDLTNSIEDLTRLDKICRIIEISDELSDKLFSSLNHTELTGLEQRTWSFRDLCERIKLDDFCNKVFGKSRS